MKRFTSSDATVHVADTGTCLLVRWDAASADTYQYLRASFGTTFPRRGEATWRRDEGGWSVAYRYHKRLNKWIAQTFEPAAVTWVQEPRQSEAGSRVEDEVPRHDTAMDLLAAYELLHLLPTAPPELVTAAYRCAARLHHPDRSGNDEMMARLNAAVACIRAHQVRAQRQP